MKSNIRVSCRAILACVCIALSSAALYGQQPFYIIDGDRCDAMGDTTEWGAPLFYDCNDPQGGVCPGGNGQNINEGSDMRAAWFYMEEDSIWFALARWDSAGTSSFGFFFDSDCDGNDDFAINWAWPISPNVPTVDVQASQPGNTLVLGQAQVNGSADCNTTIGNFLEAEISIQQLIDGGFIDPCACGKLKITSVASLAGLSLNSAKKDEPDDYSGLNTEYAFNQIPELDIVFPSVACVGKPITYDGTGSLDTFPSGDSLLFSWDFDDGNTSTAASGMHTYASPGTYDITFGITDVSYGCGVDTIITIEVFETPIADMAITFDECNLTIDYDGSNSQDNTGAGQANITFAWDFGDGNTSTAASGMHTYAATGTYTVQLIVTDPDGQSPCEADTIEQTLIFDQIAPTIMCAADIQVFLNATCVADTTPATTGTATATDNCSVASINYSDAVSMNCPGGYVVLRTWVATDGFGNADTCLQTITVSDTLAPVAPMPPADVMVACAVDVPAPVDLTAIDNCDDTLTVSPTAVVTPGSCLNDFVMVRRWTFTDTCGNTSAVTQTITVSDTLAPVAPMPPADVMVACADDVPAPVDLTAIDNCDDTLTVSPTAVVIPGSCPNDFVMVRTWTFTDTCDNTSSVTQTITVSDTLAPVAPMPPADVMVACADDVPAPVDLTAIDNCDDTLTVSPTAVVIPGSCPNDFVMVRTWTFTDTCGNTSSVSQTITVSDTLAPVPFMPLADVMIACADEVPAPVDLMAVDNCDDTLTVSPTAVIIPGSCLNDFVMVRTWTFTDTCGNTSSVTQTITVSDTLAPVPLMPPASLTIACADEVPAPVDLMAVDNCDDTLMTVSPTAVIFPGSCLNDFVMVRTWTFTDTCGNTSAVTQTITVSDTLAPVPLMPPASLTIACADEVPAPVDLMAVDNCDDTLMTVSPTAVIIPGSCPNDFVMVRTWTFTDTCGNTSAVTQTITVSDTLAPVPLMPPADVMIACADEVPAPVDLMAVDNCDDTLMTVSPTAVVIPGSCLNDFVMVRTWTFTDTCGNTSAVTQTITVSDTLAPVAPMPPADVMIACADDLPAPVDLTAIDNCDDTLTVSPTAVVIPGSCPNDFVMVRTWTFTDTCGNTSSVSQTVTVSDTLAPVPLTPPADVMLECADEIPAPVDLTAIDNCDDTLTVSPTAVVTPGSCPNDFVMVRTWTFTDTCGNTSAVTQTITVSDTLAPVPSMPPADVTVACADDVPAPVDLTAIDNCDDTLTVSPTAVITSGGCPNDFVMVRTWTFTDTCDNTSSVTQTITVTDTIAPMIDCPADTLVMCNITDIAAFGSYDEFVAGGGSATDNCEIDVSNFTLLAEVSDGLTCPETVTRTYQIADSCGNTATCAQIIMVNDTIVPTISCPIAADSSCTMMTTTYETLADFLAAGGAVDDNCGIDSMSYTVVSQVITADCPMTSTTTYRIADLCGNTASCTTVMMITDDVAPMITCPADVVVVCDTDVPAAVTTIDEFIAAGGFISDDCTLDSTSFMLVSEVNDGETCPATITRTYSVADLCGNAATCQQTITINDTIPPTAVCMDITIMFEEDLTVIVSPEDIDGGSFDNCGEVTIAITDSVFQCEDFGAGNMTMMTTLIVTDECGNTSTCVANVYGMGGLITIDCPQDQWLNLDAGECSARYYYNVIAIANCGPDPILVQVDESGLTSGDYFPIGITVQEWIAHNGMGDTAYCSFTIEVHEFPFTVPPVCNNNINVSVDENCEAFIGCDMILEGGPYGCCDSYLVEIEGVGSGMGGVLITSEQIGGTYTVTITDPETGISCWSTIHVEDKLPPQLTCISVELPCTADTDPLFQDPIIGTISLTENPGSSIGPGGGTVTTQEFVVSAPANAQVTDVDVRIDLDHTWSADLDVILIGPDGSEIILAQDVCGTANDWENVTFDDDADTPVGAACTGGSPALVGPVQPQEALAGFNGLLASGTWTLQITDDTGGDGGTLNIAGIDVDYFVALPYAPIVHEACGAVDLEYSDVVSGDECSALIIERTWIATDPSGNSSSCVQTLTITPLDLEDLEMPEAYIGECGASTDPSVTGWPTVGGIEILDGNVCNVFTTWEDKPLADCGGGTKIVRHWLVLDWCNQEVVKGIQVIKLMDNTGPVLTCPADVTVGTDTWNCYADVNLDAPTGVDACGSAFTMVPSASQGTIVDFGGYYRVDDLPLGETVITWTAEDACGNTSTCSYIITVEDDIPPVPICDEHTIVSLTNDNIDQGLTKVSAEVFDDGSYDNCSAITFEVRRMTSCLDFDWTTNGAGIDETPNGIVNSADKGTSFKPMVPFACCDVAQGPIMVELRVTDAYGNSNRCMVEVEVQDKLSPLITAPPTVEVSCEFWFAAEETNGFVSMDEDVLTPVFGRVLDAFEYDQSDRESIIIDDPGNDELPQPYNWGLEGWADDNCDVDITVRVRIYDDCSGDNLPSGAPSPYTVRLVERTFLAKDAQGNSQTAVQRIWVVDYEPFYISDETCVNSDSRDGVIWPCDELYDNCPDGGIPVNYPTIFDDNCSLIGVTFEDERFDFVEGACYKILRHWTVIDWCQYDSQTGAGTWSYIQVIKVIDSEGPEVTGGPFGPVTLCALDSNVSLPANNQVFLGENNPHASSCSVHIILEHDVVEMCSEIITYDLKIYPNNGSDYLQVLNETEAAIDSNGNGRLFFDSRASSILGVRLNGLPYNDRYCINGEKDYHRVLWSMEDGCGNTTTFEYLLRLEDCKAPSPVCLGLSSVVMPSSGAVTIWAADFNASSFDDCTAAADLLYSFSGTDYEPSRTFDCQAIDENGSPSFLVEIYAVDEGNDQNCDGIITYDERNKDFCTTFIVIDDNDGVCGGGGTAGGLIETEELESVENVTVTLMDELGLLTQTIVTDGSGTYVFVNPLLSYTIEPKRDDNDMNGVSTLDLVRIQKHLLGLDPFTSPYKLIAADANNSESVTALDLVEIRKLILGLNLEFPNNESWRFVDAEFVFQDINNPWPFDEIIELQGGYNMEEDFMAVKVGDVNGTVTANATQIEVRESRNILTLNALDRAVSVGEEVTLEVTANEFASIFGYQFTLRTEGLKLTSVDAGVVDMDAANVGLHKYFMTVSWHRTEAVDAQDGDVLFTLHFVSTMEGQLSEMMSIGSEITEAEAYRETGADPEIMDIELAFGDLPTVPTGVEFALYQNEPNPFNDMTKVGFTLPEAMDAKLTVFDMTGRVIKIVEGAYEAGYNEIELLQQDLGTSGVLYYRLDAGDLSATGNANFSASKKLIIIE